MVGSLISLLLLLGGSWFIYVNADVMGERQAERTRRSGGPVVPADRFASIVRVFAFGIATVAAGSFVYLVLR